MVLFKDPSIDQIDEAAEKDRSVRSELRPLHSSTDVYAEKDLEAYIIKSIGDEVIQERIRAHLQDIMGKELTKMSIVLREAIRNWIFKEKQKYNLAPKGLLPQALTDKLEKSEAENRQLEEENRKLKREMELKDHENKIMLSAIKKLHPKPN